MEVILFQPEIPQNTGNIIRTCSVSGCRLVLVEPIGFSLTDRWLKRAGMDYMEEVSLSRIDDLERYLMEAQKPFTFFSSKADKIYTEFNYSQDHIFIFGSESKGLPGNLFEKWPDRFAKIPMMEGKRCLNLATSVGIAVYEAARQQGFRFSPS
ncbi:tRNA (cytidine(34)-2'-O)-methyltransferase [Estrella lausannensis]|uniref:Putative tRNA (cytidine(34)-2'-O)-methyltransferase n=1 Tax=Estrella lausannensis TaxID=483423 RepID=A0A0H5E3M7_9BACT|nr:tRNA (cytidine(34)-2'-O)-methyltransferase [Estrella lausannensis]CRX37820.1 rRNA methylase, SpoU family [Estrella lausannensis]